jgi:endonuclease/exonuclease/phosphatase family metal-dependent hydrolase
VYKHWCLTAFVILSCLSYVCVFVSPIHFWPAVFISYAIPVVLLLNGILSLAIFFFNKRLALIPLITIILGLPFVIITISYQGEKTIKNHELSILSFNAKFFMASKRYPYFSPQMIQWVVNDTSTIKCIQEFATNGNSPELDVTKQIMDKGYNSSIYSFNLNGSENPVLAIFSKYDILDTGMVWEDKHSINVALYADIKKGMDTLRIYNVHLASMGLQINQYKNPNRYKSKLKTLITRLKYGSEKRSSQIDKIIAHTAECPYPFIVCGDFNETPYSYNYFKLKRHFSNAFEKAGNGFGFTLNSLLFFLRIDHHFYADEIEAIHFCVDRSMKISDHFPTRGYYRFKNK